MADRGSDQAIAENLQGLQRWRWKGMATDKLPTPDQIDEWFFSEDTDLPKHVGIGLLALDKLAERALPREDIVRRLADQGSPEHPSLEVLLFGLDQTDAKLRLRRAVARAWRIAEAYADGYLDRFEADRKPFDIAAKVRQQIPQALDLLDRLEATMLPAIGLVANWKYGSRAEILSGQVSALLVELRAEALGALEWVDSAVGLDDDVMEEPGGAATHSEIELAEHSARAWLRSLKHECRGTDGRLDTAEVAISVLEELVQLLAVNATQNEHHRRKLGRRNTQLSILTAAVAAQSGRAIRPEGRTRRPDTFLWLRLAEVYTVTFGLPAPLHGTAREANTTGQPNPQDQFNEFLKTALYCVNWPDVETIVFTDLLRQAKRAGGPKAGQQLAELLDRADIASQRLPSHGLLAELGEWLPSQGRD